MNAGLISVSEPRPPPLLRDIICEFWKVSERFTKTEVRIIASMVPRGVPLSMPWYRASFMSYFSEFHILVEACYEGSN